MTIPFLGLTYSQAATKCQAAGGDLAQPTNDLESDTLTNVLVTAATDPTDSFWIGEFRLQPNPDPKLLIVYS